MRRYAIMVIIVAIFLIILSCSRQESDDIVRIWMYRYDGDYGGNELKDLIEKNINYYSEENNINVKIMAYSDEEISEEDYLLKRNLALEYRDADIIIGDMYSGMHQISNYAANYVKLLNYENIFDNFKGKYFIPLVSVMDSIILDNQVLELYNVESDKYIIMEEYYEIKQKLKAAGARFKYEAEEHQQLLEYYINKNDLKMINENGKYTIDKQAALKTVSEIVEDIAKNYETNIVTIKEEIKSNRNRDKIIYDETSGRIFSQRGKYYPLKFLTFTYDFEMPFEYNTVVIENDIENTMLSVPCMLINKNSKKENTYKIADFLISDKFQSRIYNNTLAYSSITDTAQLRKDTGYNDDRSYKYEPGKTKIYNQRLTNKDIKEIIPVVQEVYQILKNTDTEKFFTSYEFRIALKIFIGNEAIKMVENSDYGEQEFRKSAEEYLAGFNVLYN